MKKLSDWLIQNSKTWIVLSFLIVLILFILLVLPGSTRINTADKISPDIPDLSFWYSPDHLYSIAESYGINGRKEYVIMHAGFDLIWPVVYVGFLALSLSWVFGRVSKIFLKLNLIPVIAGIFDYLENILTSIVMLRYPEHSRGIDLLAPVTTMLKWILIYLSAACLFTGLLVLFLRLYKQSLKSRDTISKE